MTKEQRASLLGARTLLGAPGLTTSNKDATRSFFACVFPPTSVSTLALLRVIFSSFFSLVASLLLVAMPGAPSSVLAPSSSAPFSLFKHETAEERS